MKQSFDVLVIGGGIVGLTAALAMAQRNYTVAVIDAGSLSVDITAADARVYAINQASQRLFKELGVWSWIDSDRISSYDKMYVWDAKNGAHIDFDSRVIAQQYLGSIVEESILKQALLQQIAAESRIFCFANTVVDALEVLDQSVEVFSGTECWQAELLVAADGANSPTRQKLHVPLTSWSYDQSALITSVRVEKSHSQTAYQVFNSDGPLAFLPLKDKQHCSIVWSTSPSRVEELMGLDELAFGEELAKAFAYKLGQVQVLSKRYQFPLHMRHVNQYVGARWLLLGDCAHTIHPLAGLGLNLGLADVRSWITCLDSGKGRFSPKQLRAYQRERKHSVWQTIALMEGFKRLFASTSQPISVLRGLGLQGCNAITPIKRLFIEHAAG